MTGGTPKEVIAYRRKFYENRLSSDDLKEVKIIKDVNIVDVPWAPHGRFMKVDGYGKVIFSGEFQSSVTRKSFDMLQKHKENPDGGRHEPYNGLYNMFDYKVEILAMNPDGKLYAEFSDYGYYSFNPHRLRPDTILAWKVIE